MSFVQVKDALNTIRNRYRSFLVATKKLSVDERHEELVRRLTVALGRMDRTVSDVAKNVDVAVLNGWIQFFPNKDETTTATSAEFASLDDLLDSYSALNCELVQMFELVSRSTECVATREIFDLLATVERQNARDLAWAERGPS